MTRVENEHSTARLLPRRWCETDREPFAALNVAGLPAGRELLLAAIDAYLDVCLANHAVKALIFETRAQSTLTTTMEDREALFAQLAEPSMRAVGMTPARISARLIVALTSEAALIEMEAGRRVSGARKAISTMLGASPP